MAGNPWHNIGPYSVRFHPTIGEGGFGSVYLARNEDDGLIAAKNVSFRNRISEDIEKLKKLYKDICKLEHHNLMYMLKTHHETTSEQPSFWLFMELCSFGDLNVIYRNHPDYFAFDQIKPRLGMMRQMIQGVSFLHDRGYAHRDIKPKNIMATMNESMQDEVVLKIGDFGLSRCLRLENDPNNQMDSDVGTNSFKAPEFFDLNKKYETVGSVEKTMLEKPYDNSVDIFSLGLTFLAVWQPYVNGKDRKENVILNLMPNVEASMTTGMLLMWSCRVIPGVQIAMT